MLILQIAAGVFIGMRVVDMTRKWNPIHDEPTALAALANLVGIAGAVFLIWWTWK